MVRPCFSLLVTACLGWTARTTSIEAWTKDYSSRRAQYYLEDARRMLHGAAEDFWNLEEGKDGPDPYLKAWSTQSQLSAALSLGETNADLWFEAGNLTFYLSGLMREIQQGEMLADCLSFWLRGVQLEASAGSSRSNSARLRSWLEDVAQKPKEHFSKLPERLLLSVREDAWSVVSKWDMGKIAVGPLHYLSQRRLGRVAQQVQIAVNDFQESGMSATACKADSGSKNQCEEVHMGRGTDWLEKKLGAGRKILFPTYIFRVNVLEELGRSLFQKLSKLAIEKYRKFRGRQLKKHGASIRETRINDNFFQSQETLDLNLRYPEARKKWPELYESEELRALLQLARNASLMYLKQTGVTLTPTEAERSSLTFWAAVYPQDKDTNARHGWHTHQESVVSGVFYVSPRNTPIIFADPRGAPPIEDYEQYGDADLLFEPKAPFDNTYQVFAREGDLVLFPSWLVHKVPPPVGKSGEDRVVYPFNFHLGPQGDDSGTVWDGWERTVHVIPVDEGSKPD